METLGTHPEAKSPSALCTQLLDRMAQVDSDLAAAERAGAAAAAGTGVAEGGMGAHHRRQSTGGGSTENAGANIGGGGPSITAALPVAWQSRSEIVCGVAYVGLQAQAAALRKHTLSRAGFQQVQLDSHFSARSCRGQPMRRSRWAVVAYCFRGGAGCGS